MGKIRRGVGCFFGVILEFFGYFLDFGLDWRTGIGRGNAINLFSRFSLFTFSCQSSDTLRNKVNFDL